MEVKETSFNRLSVININDYVEKKNGLSYVSWSNAWMLLCREYPDATYNVKKNEFGFPAFGNQEIGYFVFVEVTAGGITHEGFLPVLDFRNKAVKTPDAMNVNTSVMRCLAKTIAMFGIGLYLYQGEDIPDEVDTSVTVVSRGGGASFGMERNDGIEWLKAQSEDVRAKYLAQYNKEKGKSITDVKYMAGDFIKAVSAKDGWK